MRQNEFILDIQQRFPIESNHDLAVDIANAMHDAVTNGRGRIGSFEHDGVVYFVRTEWYDGCIGGDCNPATCYTNWELTCE